MNRLFRRNPRLPRRGPARWTPMEIGLLVLSFSLIIFPLYAEAYRWINPALAPAAPRAQATATPDPASATQGPGATADPAAEADATVPTDENTEQTPESEATSEAEPAQIDATPADQGEPIDPQQRATLTPEPGTPGTPTATQQTQPTATPTQQTGPTNTPTSTPEPTATPTDGPTATPSATPTDGPTATPSATPTDGPTATPSATPTEGTLPTNTPTVPIGEPPLAIEKVASVSEAPIGGEFSYALSVFSSSTGPIDVNVTDTVDPQLEVLSANPSNGSCSSGQTVQCTVSVQNGQPAVINITVRVRSSATPGGSTTNQAIAQDTQNRTASSEPVIVNILSNVVVTPTVTSTPDPNVPTNTPTATGEPVPPTSTPTTGPVPPTNTPGAEPPPPPPTNTPRPPDSGGDGNGDRDDDDEPSEPEPVPTQVVPPIPPTQEQGAPVSPPAPPPAQPQRPAPTRAATAPPATASPATATAVAVTATAAVTPSPQPPVDGLFFRMASDWGSAFPGQEVLYVIAVRNTHPAGGDLFENVELASTLPANLEVLDAQADRGNDPTLAGNNLSLSIGTLRPGEGVEVAVRTRIRDTVAAGTYIVSQASLTYEGRAVPVHSNIVTVLVVGVITPSDAQSLQPTNTATVAPTATTQPTSSPTTGAVATSTPAATVTATPAPGRVGAPAGGTPQGGADDSDALPETSAGLPPLFGLALLGTTLMVRTVRLHREQSRI